MEKDQLKELFNETFQNFEQAVRPELWNTLATKINVSTASGIVAKKGISLFSKLVIATAVVSSFGVIGYVLTTQHVKKGGHLELKKNEKTAQDSTPDSLSKTQDTGDKNTQHIDFCLSPKEQHEKLSSTIFSIDEVVPVDVPTETKPIVFNSSNGEQQKSGILLHEENNEVRQQNDAIQSVRDENQLTVVQTDKEDYYLGELPNVFTPNKDGINDFFRIDSKGFVDFSIVILDKNNRIVFQSDSPDFIWDGNAVDGQECEMNQYIYFITAKSSTGKMITQHHVLTLQR